MRKSTTEQLGVETIILGDAITADWTSIVHKLERVVIALIDLEPTDCKVVLEGAQTHINAPSAGPETILFNADGKSMGNLRQIAHSALNERTVKEPIFRGVVDKDELPFEVVINVPAGSYLLDTDGKKRKAAELRVQAKATRRDPTPVNLKSVSFEDAQVAYGDVNGYELKGVVSILEREGKPTIASLLIQSDDDGGYRVVDGLTPQDK